MITILLSCITCLSCIQAQHSHTKADPHALNIIYFIPKDLDPVPGYEKRLSTLLLWAQKWFEKQMSQNGYGNKTFHLTKEATTGSIKIVTIKGTKNKDEYPYEGGFSNVLREIAAYKEHHKDQLGSEYSLVILPRYSFKEDGTPHGGPYYGMSPYCFALDYEDLDIKYMGSKNTRAGYLFSVWFGGMLHELGHGLGLPHNSQKLSEGTQPEKGMALMNAGNGTLGISPTFLTAADCAILNVNPTFNHPQPYNNQQTGSSITIENFKLYYNKEKRAIIAKGIFKSPVKINSIAFYNDPNVNNEGSGVSQDYNAISWATKPAPDGSFRMEMPVDEFKYKDSTTYELRMLVIQANGYMKYFYHSYEFKDNIPLIDDNRSPIKPVKYRITNFSSDEKFAEDGGIGNLNDNDPGTYWHSQWGVTQARPPHVFQLSFTQKQKIRGIAVQQRHGLSRAVKEIELYTGTAKNQLQLSGRFRVACKNGLQLIPLPKPIAAKYASIVVTSSWDGEPFASIGELQFY